MEAHVDAGLKRALGLIREIVDYPHRGIVFQDLTPLLADAQAFNSVIEELEPLCDDIDYVAGIEARGFIFAAAVAQRARKGFVPLRKAGKLPSATHEESYGLEYGLDVLQIHQDAISKHGRVLLIDDVLATGGTLLAGHRLIERAGGVVACAATVLEITSLNGRAKLAEHVPHTPLHVIFAR